MERLTPRPELLERESDIKKPTQHRNYSLRWSTARLVAVALGSVLLSACAVGEKPQVSATSPAILPEASPVTRAIEGPHYDTGYIPDPNSIIKSIEVYFTRQGLKNAKDVVALRVCYQSPGEVRLISQQLTGDPGPGFVYNRPWAVAGQGCEDLNGVTEANPDEGDQFNMGQRQDSAPHDDTYSGWAFQTQRIGNSLGLNVQSIGLQTLNPDEVVRRPDQPESYFER